MVHVAGFPAKVYLQGFSRRDFSYNFRPHPSGNFTTGAFMSQKEPHNLWNLSGCMTQCFFLSTRSWPRRSFKWRLRSFCGLSWL